MLTKTYLTYAEVVRGTTSILPDEIYYPSYRKIFEKEQFYQGKASVKAVH